MAKANTRVTRHRGGEDHGKQKFRQSGESGQKLCKVHKIYGTRAYGCLDTDTCHVGPVQTPEVGKRVGRTLVAATSVPGHPDRLLVLRDSHVSCLLSLISFLSSPVSCPVFCIPSPVSCRTSPVSRLLAVSHLLSHISCLTSPVLRPLSIFSSLPCCKCYTTTFALSSKSILLLWCYRINFNDLGI